MNREMLAVVGGVGEDPPMISARPGSLAKTSRRRSILGRFEWQGTYLQRSIALALAFALLGLIPFALLNPAGATVPRAAIVPVWLDENGQAKESWPILSLSRAGISSEAMALEEEKALSSLAPVNHFTSAWNEQQEAPLVDRVKKAIDQGVAFLRAQEQGKGHWEVDGEAAARTGGWSSLAMLALLHAGVKPNDPMMVRGMAYLRKIAPEQTYTVSLQTMVFLQAGFDEDKPFIRRNIDWLFKTHHPARNGRAGGWGYGQGLGSPDNSNTRFALMALHAAFKSGFVLPELAMKKIEEDLRNSQQDDGGWSYRGEPFSTITMSSGGLANLINVSNDLRKGTPRPLRDGIDENCGIYEEGAAMRKGLKWLGDSFPARVADSSKAALLFRHPFYALQAIEWTGEASGERFFGGHDWYRVGCDLLVRTQSPDGSWGDSGKFNPLDGWPVVATSFSVWFLASGRTPVLISKFAHGKEGNRKQSELRNLVPFVSDNVFSGQRLAWQNFDTKRIPLNEEKAFQACSLQLLESPVVWLSGHQLILADEPFRLLKSYVDRGGFLFAEACCSNAEFDKQFRALVKKMFPGQELTLLPKDHPLWKASGSFSTSPESFPLYGITQGGKTILVYSPKAISGYWEGNLNAEGSGRDVFRLGANVIAYATGKKIPLPRLSAALAGTP